jgi:thiol-disulfide isomerase/thioredoxin
MKKIFFTVLTIAAFSCKNEISEKKTIITGKITDCSISRMYVMYSDERKKIDLDSTGIFRFECDSFIGTYYPTLQFGSYQFTTLFVLPGDSIYISYNDSNFRKTVAISGSNAEINRYLLEYTYNVASYRNCEFIPILNKYSLEKFRHFVDSANTERKNRFSDFRAKNPDADKIFIKTHSFDMDLLYASDIKGNPLMVDSVDYSLYFKKYDFNDSDLAYSRSYTEFIWGYLNNALARMAKKDSFYASFSYEHTKKKLQMIDELFQQPSIRERFKYIMLRWEWMQIFKVEGIDSAYNAYMSTSTHQKHKADLKNQYEVLSKIAKGKPAPNFSCEDKTGKTVQLSDLKGKAMVLKFWATWCPPCVQSIPYMQQLQKDAKDMKILFVDVSVDDSTAKKQWLAMIREKKMSNLQIYTGGWDNPVSTDYCVFSIPYYVLIDKNGNFFSTSNDHPTKADLEKLIK